MLCYRFGPNVHVVDGSRGLASVRGTLKPARAKLVRENPGEQKAWPGVVATSNASTGECLLFWTRPATRRPSEQEEFPDSTKNVRTAIMVQSEILEHSLHGTHIQVPVKSQGQ